MHVQQHSHCNFSPVFPQETRPWIPSAQVSSTQPRHRHLQRGSQQLCCRDGARSSRASGAPRLLRSHTRSLLPFSSLGRFISAPLGPFLPSCKEAASPRHPRSSSQGCRIPACALLLPLSHTDTARRPPRAPAPEAFAPHLPGKKKPRLRWLLEGAVSVPAPEEFPARVLEQAAARRGGSAAPCPAFGRAAAGLEPRSYRLRLPVSPARRQREAPPSQPDTPRGISGQTGVSQAQGWAQPALGV